MRIPRIYHPEPLTVGQLVTLSDDAANHVGRVLRMTADDELDLFDGSNQVFRARITESSKRQVTATVTEASEDKRESPLRIHSGQVIYRGDKMEFTIEK